MSKISTPSKGDIMAANAKQEWLLPWWWRPFSATNSHLPVTFLDLGLWIKNTYLYHQDYLKHENLLLKTVHEYNLPLAFFKSRYNCPSLIDEKGESSAIGHHLGENRKQKLLRHESVFL